MLGLLDAHFVVSIAGADAFAGHAVDRDRDRHRHNVADLFNIFHGVGPMWSRVIENIGDRMPFYIIDHLDISIPVAPAFTLLNKFRIDVSSQLLERRRKIEYIARFYFGLAVLF